MGKKPRRRAKSTRAPESHPRRRYASAARLPPPRRRAQNIVLSRMMPRERNTSATCGRPARHEGTFDGATGRGAIHHEREDVLSVHGVSGRAEHLRDAQDPVSARPEGARLRRRVRKRQRSPSAPPPGSFLGGQSGAQPRKPSTQAGGRAARDHTVRAVRDGFGHAGGDGPRGELDQEASVRQARGHANRALQLRPPSSASTRAIDGPGGAIELEIQTGAPSPAPSESAPAAAHSRRHERPPRAR